MKKIVLITECLTKGVGQHVTDLYKGLNVDNNKIFVLYGKNRSEDKFIDLIEKEDRIEVTNLSEKLGITDIKSIIEIKKILNKINPDIVHLHSSKAGLSGRIAAKRVKCKKIIYSPHAYFFLKYKEKSLKFKLFLFAEKFLSKFYTNYTITTSKGEDEVYKKYKIDKDNKKIFIPHGINEHIISEKKIEEERKKYGVGSEEILVGSMARFEKQKDPYTTFEILDKVSKQNGVKAIFYGDGSMYEEIKNIADNKKSNVILPGNINDPELDLKILDIYLTASLYEGLPYTLIQALSLKLPIISTNVVGNSDCVLDGQNGYLFNIKDVDVACKNINKIIDTNSFEKMGMESYKIYKEKYSLDNMIQKYKKIYEIGEK